VTPDAALSMLDRLIRADGQNVTIFFVEASSETQFPTRAFVRGYLPHELIGGIEQGDTLAVISATGLIRAPRLPRRNDRLLLSATAAMKNIESPGTPIELGEQLVRMNLQLRG
jgi:hypothetical protein